MEDMFDKFIHMFVFIALIVDMIEEENCSTIILADSNYTFMMSYENRRIP